MNLALARFVPKGIRLSDGFILGCLVAFIGLLIIPMPAWALDMFIACNLVIGMMLLLAAIYVTKPLDFSTFPSVLLFTTLFRLGIAVATTRAILTDAHAGKIVQQFGAMVAGGQLLVGFVVFLIIVIVQLIVISKGAERVAEVGARFSLDAMPGKQLSIDSDLRSGLITRDEARAKRRELELESKFHGSLDGAMKFVKGDAIATICIIIVNLLGGFAVGVINHGMDFATAAETFSILTIGDGLVSQLPAFFSAIAAGMLVTRTTDADTDQHLGPAIARQLWGQPHVLMIAAGLCLLLAAIPGFPAWAFAAIAVALMAGGLAKHSVAGPWMKSRVNKARGRVEAVPAETVLKAEPLKAVEPLVLRLIAPSSDRASVDALTTRLQQTVNALQDRSGVQLPVVRMRVASDETVNGAGWQLLAYDAPIGAGALDGEDVLGQLPPEVARVLQRHLGMFLGLQEVTNMLNWLGEDYPEVVKEAVRAVPTTTIAEVLRMLVDEQVPLRNLRDVVEAIGEAGQSERLASAIAERVRVNIRRHIVAPICGGGSLKVLMVGAALEEAIRGTLTQINETVRLAINPMQMQALTRLLREELAATGAQAVLTAQDLRRPLRLVIAADMYDVPVISFNELAPSVPLDVVGELKILPEPFLEDNVMEAAE